MTPADRAHADSGAAALSGVLRRLADAEHDTSRPALLRPAFPLGWAGRALLLLTAVRIAGCLVAILTGVVPPRSAAFLLGSGYTALQLVAFGAAGMVLLVGHAGDARTARLGALLVVVASAFTPIPFQLVSDQVLGLAMLAPLYPDAFLPFFLGRFMEEFPRRRGKRRMDHVLRFLVRLSLVTGAVLFAGNAVLGWTEPGTVSGIEWLARTRVTGTAYWTLLFALLAVMLPLSFVGTSRLDLAERRRVRLFWTGFVIGIGPLVLAIVLASIPSVGRWMGAPTTMSWLFPLVQVALASVSLTVAYAVGVRRMLPLRVVIRKAVGYVLARASVTVAFVAPIAVLTIYVYQHRDQTVATVLGGPARWLLWATGVTGAALVGRERLLRAIDQAFFREAFDTREVLIDLGESSRRAQSLDELVARLTSGIDRAFRPDHLAILIRDQAADSYVSLFGSAEPMPARSVIADVLRAAAGPVEPRLGDPASPFRWLPRAERQWLVDTASRLLVPMRAQEGDLAGLITVSERKSELPYSAEDRRLLSAIADAGALTIAHQTLKNAAEGGGRSTVWRASINPQGARAVECSGCGAVFPAGSTHCAACGGGLTASEVPFVLFGKFRFEARIGRGGMGVVYRAVDLALDRPVAVKTLPDATPEQSQRLRTEAKVMAAVAHPNLAAIYGAESWHGKPFLICEFMPHGTLADRLSGGIPLPLEDGLRLGLTLAEALQVVHEMGLLHRDLKPSNIGFGDRRVPKLLDFGLVHMLTAAESRRPGPGASGADARWLAGLTVDGSLIGTPLYLSPEAVQGAAPSAAFDLWSLHVLLIEAITGRHPFRASSVEETLERVRAAGIEQALDHFRPEARDVAAYFQQALSRNERVRPPRAADVALSLRDLIGRRVASA